MKKVQSTTSWRELSIASYKAPSDSKIFGTFDVDITELLKYIAEQKKRGYWITLEVVVIYFVILWTFWRLIGFIKFKKPAGT